MMQSSIAVLLSELDVLDVAALLDMSEHYILQLN